VDQLPTLTRRNLCSFITHTRNDEAIVDITIIIRFSQTDSRIGSCAYHLHPEFLRINTCTIVADIEQGKESLEEQHLEQSLITVIMLTG
jgi:hypothetical protein